MTIQEQKTEKRRLYALGYYEAELRNGSYIWRCSNCKEQRQLVECSCNHCLGRCENCVGKPNNGTYNGKN
jgi:hypothetical protein